MERRRTIKTSKQPSASGGVHILTAEFWLLTSLKRKNEPISKQRQALVNACPQRANDYSPATFHYKNEPKRTQLKAEITPRTWAIL